MLRDYQQAAFDRVIEWVRLCVDPCLIEAATGAGKSHIVAAVAEWVTVNTGKRVLCLAPSKELTEQNHEKYLATGNPASFYSASIDKSLVHDVVFGTPQTVKNSIDKFCSRFAAIIIDEAHGITPTIKAIVDGIKLKNPKVRVIGLSATPYRTGDGYIYAYDEHGKPVEQAKNPFFNTLIYRITANELIDQGYLTPPVAQEPQAHYDTSGIVNFTAKESEQAFEGKGRKTAAIVKQVVELSRDRMGVIIFAATIRHAKEVLESLPLGAELVTGSTPKKQREDIIKRFKAQGIKYLVNCSVLTTGFDAPHIDVVAVLRATESPGLFQQIIGRGLRLYDDKTDCLVLDYAENIQRHCPGGDIFNPEIRALPTPTGEHIIHAQCPDCLMVNDFKGRPNPDELQHNAEGYFVDLDGEPLDLPAHYGRRCQGQNLLAGLNQQCSYRWTLKECPDCQHENDIAARDCEGCGAEIIDPNEKLKLDFYKMKSDPCSMTTDKVLGWKAKKWKSNAGNDTLKVDFTTEYRTFSAWYMPSKQRLWADLCIACFGKVAPTVDAFAGALRHAAMPETVSVKRDKTSKFFTVYGHNRPESALQ